MTHILLSEMRKRIDKVQVRNSWLATILVQLIPAACPFERDIKFGKFATHIPPLCKLNPLYDQLVGLRFKAQEYLESH